MRTMPTTRMISDVRPIRRPKISTVSITFTSRKRSSVRPDVLDQGPDHEGEPDGHQQELEQAGPPCAHRPPHHLLEEDAEQRGRRHREEDAEYERHPPGDVHQVRHVGAEGEEVAVGEVDQLEDPVDEGEADRAERVDRPEREAVEPGLRDVVQALGGDHHDDDHRQDHERGSRRMPVRALPKSFDRRGARPRSAFRLPYPRGSYSPCTGDVRSASASLARTSSITASVNSVVPAWPPRSEVRVPAATRLEHRLVDRPRGAPPLRPLARRRSGAARRTARIIAIGLATSLP